MTGLVWFLVVWFSCKSEERCIALALCSLRPFPRSSSTLVCCVVVVPVWMNEFHVETCPDIILSPVYGLGLSSTVTLIVLIWSQGRLCLSAGIIFRHVSDNCWNSEKGIYDFKQTRIEKVVIMPHLDRHEQSLDLWWIHPPNYLYARGNKFFHFPFFCKLT